MQPASAWSPAGPKVRRAARREDKREKPSGLRCGWGPGHTGMYTISGMKRLVGMWGDALACSAALAETRRRGLTITNRAVARSEPLARGGPPADFGETAGPWGTRVADGLLRGADFTASRASLAAAGEDLEKLAAAATQRRCASVSLLRRPEPSPLFRMQADKDDTP